MFGKGCTNTWSFRTLEIDLLLMGLWQAVYMFTKKKHLQLLSYKYLAYYYIFVANLTLSSDTLYTMTHFEKINSFVNSVKSVKFFIRTVKECWFIPSTFGLVEGWELYFFNYTTLIYTRPKLLRVFALRQPICVKGIPFSYGYAV